MADDAIEKAAVLLMDLDNPEGDPRRSIPEVREGYRIRARALAAAGLLAMAEDDA